MGPQGIFSHQLLGHLPRQRAIDTALDVDRGKLIKLKCRVVAQLLALAREIRPFGVGLRAHRHIFAGGHRHGASHQPRDTRDQDSVLRRRRLGNADDQARGRDNAVVGPEHCGSQPPDAGDEVGLRVQPKTAHPTFRRSGQIHPNSIRMTRDAPCDGSRLRNSENLSVFRKEGMLSPARPNVPVLAPSRDPTRPAAIRRSPRITLRGPV